MSVVVVARYTHKHGEDVRVFKDYNGARRWQTEIGCEWWSQEFPDEKQPELGDIGSEYFAHMGDRPVPETFEYDQYEVEE